MENREFDSGLDVVSGPGSRPGGQNYQGQSYPAGGGQNWGAQGGLPGGNTGGIMGAAGEPLHAVRQRIQDQINSAVDHYAGQIPGGDRFSPEAKQAISGVLDGLQQRLENEAQNRLGNAAGGLFGGNKPDQGGQL